MKSFKYYDIQINKHNKTVKSYFKQKINGEIVGKESGWIKIKIFGEPYKRGFAHGYLLKKELKKLLIIFPFLIEESKKIRFSEFLKKSNELIVPKIKKYYPEYYEEIRGIADGCKKAGVNISIDFLISWNSHMSLSHYLNKNYHNHCSAFIATGNATKNGDIIMAHNTHTDFATGQLYNIVMQVNPDKGFPFLMQTSPGLIASVSDWFICSTGIIGSETTISGTNYIPKFGTPFFCRIRESMQYGETLDDYVKIMKKNNAGDYACSWLLGNVNTNEIMLFELGLKEFNIKKTKNGVFYGMNSAISDKLRKKETNDIDHNNITTSVGARNSRLNELLNKKYYGKININIAKEIMGDHYDVYLNKNIQNSRGICKHLESSIEHCKKPPFYPFGTTDAKVVDTQMAKNNSFMGIFGSGCGRAFSIKKHIREHPEYKNWEGKIEDLKSEKWIKIEI